MNYQLRNNLIQSSRGNRYRLPTQIVAGIIVFLILLRLIFPSAMNSFFATLFSPLFRLGQSISSAEFFTTHAALVSENDKLKEELAQASVSPEALAVLQEENAFLKASLGRSTPKKTVLATVLKQPPLSGYDTLVVDLGSNNSIKVGNKVYAATINAPGTSMATSTASSTASIFTIIGQVVEVHAKTSDVKLFSAAGEKFDVEFNPSHIHATAFGRGGGGFETTLAQNANVHEGDAVTVPDIQPVIFGTVKAIVTDPARPYMSVLFQNPINIYELQWVQIEHE